MSTTPEGVVNPFYVTGFCDGEACFTVHIYKDTRLKNGYNIVPLFSIGLHNKDIKLLNKIKTFFKEVGKLRIINKACFY